VTSRADLLGALAREASTYWRTGGTVEV